MARNNENCQVPLEINQLMSRHKLTLMFIVFPGVDVCSTSENHQM